MATPSTEYGAAFPPFTPVATPQDIFTITGSATRVVGVERIGISSVQSIAGMNAWRVVRRSTVNTGGTFVAVPAVPFDSAYVPATATIRKYTANPVAGTLLGDLWDNYVYSPDVAGANSGNGSEIVEWFVNHPILLRNANEVLAVNFNGAAVPAGMMVSMWLQFIEF